MRYQVRNYRNDIVFYCDMDNVLAWFDGMENAVERFREEKDFFYNLEPIENNVNGIKLLNALNYKVYILSASPNKRCDNDKRKWLEKYLPFIPKENYIFCRIGDNKADFIKERGILFDDYGKNIREWQMNGMSAFKITKEKSILDYVSFLKNDI